MIPTGTMGWRTLRGAPTRTHPLVAESMREVLDKAEKERSGVVSEVVKRLPLYRDPLIAAATASSDFRIDDLVNHVQPARCIWSCRWESRDRLRAADAADDQSDRAPPDGQTGLQGMAARSRRIAVRCC